MLPVIRLAALYPCTCRPVPNTRQSAYAYQRAPYQYYNVSYLENIRYVDPFVPELGVVSADRDGEPNDAVPWCECRAVSESR